MTFATDILKPVSERFALVLVTPRAAVEDWTPVGGSVYTANYDFGRIDSLTIDGDDSTVNSYSLDDGVLTVDADVDLSTNSFTVIATFKLYMTGVKQRDTYGNTAGLDEALWQPWIKQYPSWSQSMRDISEGVFSIAGTELQIISDDRLIQKCMGPNFSWSKAPVYVWICIDSVNVNRLVFSGEVANATITSNVVSLQVNDLFQKLNQADGFGIPGQTTYYDGNSPWSVTVQPANQGQAIPLSLGITSPLIVGNGYRISEAFGATATIQMYHLADGMRCVPVSDNLDSSTSVKFSCGRLSGSAVVNMNFGTIARAYKHFIYKDIADSTNSATIYSRLYYLSCSGFTGQIGDYIPAGVIESIPAWVCHIGPFSHAGNSYNVAFSTVEYEIYTGPGAVDGAFGPPSIPDNTYPSMSVWVDGTGPASYQIIFNSGSGLYGALPRYSGRYVPFTLSYENSYVYGGVTIRHVYVTVASADINSSGAGGSAELPGRLNLKCRFSPDDPLTHGEAMKLVCTSAGFDTNAASFLQADVDYPVFVCMTVPKLKLTEFPSLLSIAQDIARSTFGLLRVNDDREVEYLLTPVPADETPTGVKNQYNMLEGDTSTSVEYQDIYTDVIFQNPEFIDSSNSAYTRVTTDKSRYLHEISRTKIFNHVLAEITGRSQQIAGYLASPTVEYNLSTSSEDLSSKVGDVVTIDNNVVTAIDTEVNGMIVSVNASGSKTNLKINEMRGVE